jgi:hypothetical protein
LVHDLAERRFGRADDVGGRKLGHAPGAAAAAICWKISNIL